MISYNYLFEHSYLHWKHHQPQDPHHFQSDHHYITKIGHYGKSNNFLDVILYPSIHFHSHPNQIDHLVSRECYLYGLNSDLNHQSYLSSQYLCRQLEQYHSRINQKMSQSATILAYPD